MGLLGLLVGRAALIAIENAQRRAQEREQQRATQPPPLPPRVGTFEDLKEGFIKGYNAYQTSGSPGAPPEYIARDNTLHNTQTFSAAAAMANAQADRIRQLEEQVEQLRTNQDYSNNFDEEELRERQAQKAREREEKKKAEEAEERRKKQQKEQEELLQKRREAEAKASREAAAQADKARRRKRWDEYKASWELFRSLTSEAALFKSVQEIVPWPTGSGRFPEELNEAEIRLFFVTGASFDMAVSRKTFVEERKRWHPDSMNRWILQKGKEIDGKTCNAITAIAQILNELCVAQT